MGACAPRTKEQAVQGCPVVRTRCDARTAQFCGGTRRVLALGARPAQLERECRRGEAPGRCASGSARSGGREGGDTRRTGLCARGGLRGCPWQGGTSFAMATYPDAQKTKNNIRTVGFEPTPSKRPVPETGALDRSARSARGFSPLVCYITLANSPRSICFVCQKNPFSSFSPLRRRVPRLTPPHAWTPTRQGRSRALERSCALFSRGDARDVRELGA